MQSLKLCVYTFRVYPADLCYSVEKQMKADIASWSSRGGWKENAHKVQSQRGVQIRLCCYPDAL